MPANNGRSSPASLSLAKPYEAPPRGLRVSPGLRVQSGSRSHEPERNRELERQAVALLASPPSAVARRRLGLAISRHQHAEQRVRRTGDAGAQAAWRATAEAVEAEARAVVAAELPAVTAALISAPAADKPTRTIRWRERSERDARQAPVERQEQSQ